MEGWEWLDTVSRVCGAIFTVAWLVHRFRARKSSESSRKMGADDGRPWVNHAFVLLNEPRLPDGPAIAAAFSAFAPPNSALGPDPTAHDGKDDRGLKLLASSGEHVIVALIPSPIPRDEAERASQFSLSRIRGDWRPRPHHAHLVVSIHGPPGVPPATRLARFTAVIAAVATAASADAVYWGSAGATHDAEFFRSIASDRDHDRHHLLWSGVDVTRGPDGRLFLFSLGMGQLERPDLLVVAGPRTEPTALDTFYDILAVVSSHDPPLNDGDLIGRSADQRVPIRYIPHPGAPNTPILLVELP